MGLATGQNVRDYGNLDPSVTDDLLIPHLNAARRELKSWVGSTNYAAAEAAGAEEDIRIDLVEAEAFLAYSFAIEFVGIRHRPEGFTIEGELGDGQYRFLGPGEVQKIKGWARDRARKAAEPYMSSSTPFHLGQAGSEDDENE